MSVILRQCGFRSTPTVLPTVYLFYLQSIRQRTRLYRAPSETAGGKPLEALTHRHPHKPPFIIIGGYLNYPTVNWKSVTMSDTSADNLLDLLNDFHLQQLVNVPTWHSLSVSSILNLVLTSYPASIPDLTVDREFSDHCIVSFSVLLAPTFTHTPPRKFFLYNRGDYDQLRADLDDFQCSFLSYPDTNPVEVNWRKFKHALLSAVEKNVSCRHTGTHKSRSSWLNASVHKLIRRHDRLAKKAKKCRSAIDRHIYRKARNVATKAMEAQYNIHLNTIFGYSESDPRGFYWFIKSRRTYAVGITSLKAGGKILLTDLDKPSASATTLALCSLWRNLLLFL